jgi:rSAM/selenodomain-associated transferase 2
MQSKSPKPCISIIVPILNEEAQMPELLAHLQELQREHCEVILVDGGSQDQTAKIAVAYGFTVLVSGRGRAVQMNFGAAHAHADSLLFLHADTRLPKNAIKQITAALEKNQWGRFDVQISGSARMFSVISWFMNHRSRLTGIATGDQAIFIRRGVFDYIQGFPKQALMEDIELSKRLKRVAKPACIEDKVLTSGRRWQDRGIWRTILLMWRLRLAYWRGVSPDLLVEKYR